MSVATFDPETQLPPVDACAGKVYPCGRSRADHEKRYLDGGPGHDFVAPYPAPRPEHIASSMITTEWACTHCGAEQDVWGVADQEWMECGRCGKQSYLSFDPTGFGSAGPDHTIGGGDV